MGPVLILFTFSLGDLGVIGQDFCSIVDIFKFCPQTFGNILVTVENSPKISEINTERANEVE